MTLPDRCGVCSGPTTRHAPVCASCVPALPWHSGHAPACVRCAEAIPPGTATALCAGCLQRAPPFDQTVAVFRWADPLNDWISGLKYHAQFHQARRLVLLAAPVFRAAPRPDWLIPTPLHPRKLRSRGFNQAIELARHLSPALALPVAHDAVVRVRNTEPQQGLRGAARRRNLRGAFAAGNQAAAVRHAHVAIVDDVVSTGTTAAELARTLRRAGAARVDVWCLARATIDRSSPAPPVDPA